MFTDALCKKLSESRETKPSRFLAGAGILMVTGGLIVSSLLQDSHLQFLGYGLLGGKSITSRELTFNRVVVSYLYHRALVLLTNSTVSLKHVIWVSGRIWLLPFFSSPNLLHIFCSIPSYSNQQVHNFEDVQLYNFIYYTERFRSLSWPYFGCCTAGIKRIR